MWSIQNLLLCIIFRVWRPGSVGGEVRDIFVLRVVLVGGHGTPGHVLCLGARHVLANTVVQSAECHELPVGEPFVLDDVLHLEPLALGETVRVQNSLALTLHQKYVSALEFFSDGNTSWICRLQKLEILRMKDKLKWSLNTELDPASRSVDSLV